MSQMPETIWAAKSGFSEATMWWPDEYGGGTKYTRSDIAQSELDRVKAERDAYKSALVKAADVKPMSMIVSPSQRLMEVQEICAAALSGGEE